MPTMTLRRGDAYTLPDPPCKFCGEHKAVYLFHVQRTVEERATRRFRAIFQCSWCHATRVRHFVDSERSAEGTVTPA